MKKVSFSSNSDVIVNQSFILNRLLELYFYTNTAMVFVVALGIDYYVFEEETTNRFLQDKRFGGRLKYLTNINLVTLVHIKYIFL